MRRDNAWIVATVVLGAAAAWYAWQRASAPDRHARRVLKARGSGFRAEDPRGSDVDGDLVESASAASFPASDPPSWGPR